MLPRRLISDGIGTGEHEVEKGCRLSARTLIQCLPTERRLLSRGKRSDGLVHLPDLEGDKWIAMARPSPRDLNVEKHLKCAARACDLRERDRCLLGIASDGRRDRWNRQSANLQLSMWESASSG